eukprot:683293-Pyramimonas_sp.AAC.3
MSPRSKPEIPRLKRSVSPSTFHVPSDNLSLMYAPTPRGRTTPPSAAQAIRRTTTAQRST